MANETKKPLHRKITRSLLGFLTVFCQINIREYNDIKLFTARRKGTDKVDGGGQSKAFQAGAPLWTKLVVCLYVYLNVRLLSVMYWQYQYDYDFSKLRQIDARLAILNSTDFDCSHITGDNNKVSGCEFEFERINVIREFHQARYEKLRARIKSLGQPWVELHWMGIGTANILLLYTFYIYMGYIMLIHLKVMKPLDLYFIRSMLSEPYETIKCRRLVQVCARHQRDSSRNYVLNEMRRSEEIVGFVSGRASKTARVEITQIASKSRLAVQLQNHLTASDHLQELLQAGQLMPLNRTRTNIDRMSQKFALMSVLNLIYSFVFDSLIFHVLPVYFDLFHLDTLMDWRTYLELWAITEISVFAITFYMVVLNIITTDQMEYIVKLEKRMTGCIVTNDKHFSQFQCKTSNERGENYYEPINVVNRNLVEILMEYEIFITQFKPIQATFSFVAKGTTLVAFSGPMLCRAFMMYAEGGHRSIGIYFCAISTIFTDQLLIPLTRINNSSKILYTRMTSLLSQAIEFNIMLTTVNNSQRTQQMVDRHLIWQLRNILIDSKKFTQQFAAHVTPSIPLTVPNLIRLHYWYVLLILSYYCKLDSWKTILGNTQDDPLNLLGAL